MSDNKLKIRIQIQQQPQEAIEQLYPNLPEPQITYEEVWDWRKISIAIALIIIIVAVISYFLLTDNSREKRFNNEIPIAELMDLDSKTKTVNLSTPIESEPQLEAAPTGDEYSESDSAQPVESVAMNPEAPIIESKPILIPARKPGLVATSQLTLPTREIPRTAQQTKPQESSNHPFIVRLQLSHTIQAREPTDDIDSIQLQQGQSQMIHFFMQLKNLQGQKVRVDWYHENELSSQLTLQVHEKNWRTYASKQLDDQRLGQWRVELIDASGKWLAVKNFTVSLLKN